VTRDRSAENSKLPSAAPSSAAAIAAEVRQAILNGTYKFGERLPAERDLANHFGASRSTIRDALKRLETSNLLSRRIGSGTFVTHRPVPDGQSIAEVTSPLELIEVRFALEPRLAHLAAISVTQRDLQRLEKALDELEAAGPDREAFSLGDERFHLILAECTRNPLMIWLYQQVNEVRSHKQWGRMKEAILTPERILAYNRHHRAMFEALSSHDAVRAVEIITEHLQKAREDLVGAGTV
jgi:DNA-binding FadR family transcriptional regulator